MTDFFHIYPNIMNMEQNNQFGSLASALRLKLNQLPPFTFPAKAASHRRFPSDVSSPLSNYSNFSFSSAGTGETDATELATPFRSRASTLLKSELARPSTPKEHIPCKPPLKVILGTASLGSSKSPMARITTPEDAAAFVSSFRARGYSDIDTARAYPVGRVGTCERLLGDQQLRLGTWANVSTKVSSFMRGSHRARSIDFSINKSLASLGTETVDIMYLHAPDRATSFEETCFAMDAAYKAGKFERFGLSNYSVADVEEIVEICERNNLVKPTVYQGQYNAICRGAEYELLTVLRKHNIAFYAYSPSACGFFSSKVSRASADDSTSRWNSKNPLGAKYSQDYFHDFLFAAADVVKEAAAVYGISGHAAALRWTTWHSDLQADLGDAIIIGASSQAQLEENLDILEQGPLPDPLIQVIEGVWEDVRDFEQGPKFSFVQQTSPTLG